MDYSGGKDMSFIEDSANPNQGIALPPDVAGPVQSIPRHYPNGVTMSLTFQEILNLDRRRYTNRVSAYAMGQSQDVDSEMADFEKELNANIDALSNPSPAATEYQEWQANPNMGYDNQESAYEFMAKHNLGATHKVEKSTIAGGGYSYTRYKIVPKGEGE